MMTDSPALFSETAALIKKNFTQLETWPKKGYFLGSKKSYFLETIVFVSIPICIWGFLGNGITLWILCTKTKKTRFTIYVINLVIADLIVIIYYLTVFILFLVSTNVDLYFSRVMENFYLISYNASIYFFTAMSTERFLMVFMPVCYYHHRPKHMSVIVSVILWALSCIVSLVVYISCLPRFLVSHHQSGPSCDGAIIFKIFVNILIFFPIMIFCTLSLFIRMQRKAKLRDSEKLDVTITAITILYLSFVVSVRIVDAIAHWEPRLDAPVPFLFTLLFDSIKSTVTPLVYVCVGCCHQFTTVAPIHQFLARALEYKIKGSKDQAASKKPSSRVTWAPEVR
ncbi:proto-oncogene Mas [Anolis carolinensis]|uniref:proto-oncogene Mas n=1 Tax=Anolis carolinensis TaxID=28377 RepID=UPI0002C88EE5|nr:PREDICTED: proto-oncogene Mas-like [Anolis carolinensis]|eukprot:XP_008121475.1 PREDICTED: proto-oncogene Mas-like [Anolis carolinensis]